MWRTALKILVATAMLGFATQQANAFGHRCWGGGFYGGWGYPGLSCGGWGCGYGGWGCGYGGCGYAGWGYGFPAYGWGGYYAPIRMYPPLFAAARASQPNMLITKAEPNSVRLNVSVPGDARVFINDHPTTSIGEKREYVSRDLRSDAKYAFKVRAEFQRDGQPVVKEKTVELTAGQVAKLDLRHTGAAQTAATPTRTRLVVHLPADARLFLAGQDTDSTGPVREFATTELAPGAAWQTYNVRAVLNRDGHEEVRQQRVTLTAGQTQEVSLDFDVPHVADAR